MNKYVIALLITPLVFGRSAMEEVPRFGDPAEQWTKSVSTNEIVGGYQDLLPFVMSSPYQDEAGSCLYMTITGNVEWWLAKKNPQLSRDFNGPIDLSERYLMNLSGVKEENNGVKNWKTDTVFIYNRKQKGVRNSDFPFTKGYYKSVKGKYVLAKEGDEGARYGASYNWIAQLDKVPNKFVELPKFTRKVLFADPASNQWNTVVAPDNIVEVIKKHLRENKAPVQVIYNHYGYWHANMIVGYKDEESHDCNFVGRFPKYMKDKAKDYRENAESADEAKKKILLARAAKYEKMGGKVEVALKDKGCGNKGMFMVRDSLYPDPTYPEYDYDANESGEETNWTRKVVWREYAWAKLLVNHVIQINVED